MHNSRSLLTVLQHADTFFPSGGMAFSWGLETLHDDGLLLTAAAIESFLRGQLAHRWATCDRVALVRTHDLADDLDRVAACDAEMERQRAAVQRGPDRAELRRRLAAKQAAGAIPHHQ